MLEIRPVGSLKDTNELRRTDALAIKSDIGKILKHNDKVFLEIGKIFDVKTNEVFWLNSP